MEIITCNDITVNELIENPTLMISNPAVFSSIQSDMEAAECPCCGHKTGLTYFSSYLRQLYVMSVTDFIIVEFPVFKCNNPDCPHPYHSIIPAEVSPFKSFAYKDVLQICEEYQNAKDKEAYAQQLKISSRTIRKWIATLKTQEIFVKQSGNSLYDYTWSSYKKLLEDLKSHVIPLLQFLNAFYLNSLTVFHQNISTRPWCVRYNPG